MIWTDGERNRPPPTISLMDSGLTGTLKRLGTLSFWWISNQVKKRRHDKNIHPSPPLTKALDSIILFISAATLPSLLGLGQSALASDPASPATAHRHGEIQLAAWSHFARCIVGGARGHDRAPNKNRPKCCFYTYHINLTCTLGSIRQSLPTFGTTVKPLSFKASARFG